MHIQPSRKLRILGVVAGAALLGSAIAAAPASAKPGPAAAGSWNSHCVITMAHGSSKAASQSCFGTFTEAISFATGGAVTDAPAASGAAANAALVAKVEAANTAAMRADSHAAVAAPLVIGVEFQNANFDSTGWTLTLNGSTTCTGPTTDVEYSLNLPSPVFDQISSFTNFNNCFTDHYFLQNFVEPRTGFFNDSASVPSMNIGGGPVNGNDNTRSLTWS